MDCGSPKRQNLLEIPALCTFSIAPKKQRDTLVLMGGQLAGILGTLNTWVNSRLCQLKVVLDKYLILLNKST